MKYLITLTVIFLISQLTFAQSALNALQFDGVDDQVNANLPPLFNNISSNDFTMEAWVKPQASAFSRIIFAQSSNTNFATISTNVGNIIYFYVVSNGTTYSIATTNTLPLNSWTHVAASWTAATNQIAIYFNGVLQAAVNGGSSSAGPGSLLSIGTRPGGAQYFNGSIDEVRIWSEARSACEIFNNYQSELAGTESNLVAYYNFNQGIADATNTGITNLPELVSANDGTMVNFALTGSTSNWTASGATLINTGEMGGTFYSFQDEICSGYSYDFNGQMLTASGIYSDTLPNAVGCDSIVTLDLTVLPVFQTTEQVSSCGPYIWSLNGQTYAFPGIFKDTVTAVNGCDSIVNLQLSVHSIPTSNFTDNGDGTFTAVYSGFLQWIDCTTGTVVFGGSTFAPQQNGNYALVAADGVTGCDDTSACFLVDYLNIDSKELLALSISPNPTSNEVHISFSGSDAYLTVYDLKGKVVLKDRIQNYGTISLQNLERGVYLFDFNNSQGHSVQRVVKQ